MRVLGVDPSLTNLGYVVIEDGTILEKGKIQTTQVDGLTIQRYLLQVIGLSELICKYNIKYLATESPVFQDFSSEILYGLQSFLQLLYWNHGLRVLMISPLRVKSYALPGFKGKIHKRDMVNAARLDMGLRENQRLANDVADAYWVAKLGYRWWSFFENLLKKEDLTEKEFNIFLHQHTFTRGKKKGVTEKKGVFFRENELYYLYDKLLKPKLNFLK